MPSIRYFDFVIHRYRQHAISTTYMLKSDWKKRCWVEETSSSCLMDRNATPAVEDTSLASYSYSRFLGSGEPPLPLSSS